ncbi:hypothetical protein BH09PSE2_BH09PSE2_07440 [soil metagenome]
MTLPVRLLTALCAAVSACALAGGAPAFAAVAEGSTVATLAAPSTAPVSILIDNRLWVCAGAECSAKASGAEVSQSVTRECTRAAAVLGAFSAYQTGRKALTAEQLAACNATAKR